ncbi:ComF family protein [Streptomyces sp. NPDC054796]
MRELWQELQQELTGLVLPADCAGCGSPRARGQLCRECSSALTCAVPRRVWPSQVPSGLPAVYGAVPYADEARAVLLAHKERGALRLAAPLGAVLAGAVRMAVAGAGATPPATPHVPRGPVSLVPVPSARRAVAGRGHDPVRRMAVIAARELRRSGVPARVLTVLRQRRAVADQARLTAEQRLANLNGALESAPGSARFLEEGETVLVDDLMTTGASLVEAARAISVEAGGVAGAAVVAWRP